MGLCRYMRLEDWSVGFRFVGTRSMWGLAFRLLAKILPTLGVQIVAYFTSK